MPIRKNTLMTFEQAQKAFEDNNLERTPLQRFLLRQYMQVIAAVEQQQSMYAPNLCNPKGIQSDAWCKVHQLIEDISFGSVDQRTKDQLSEIESKLKAEGVINEKSQND